MMQPKRTKFNKAHSRSRGCDNPKDWRRAVATKIKN